VIHRRHSARLLRAAVAVVAAFPLASPGVVGAADDITPPIGRVTIGDGSGYASSLDISVHAPATDDVGVVSMTIYLNGQFVESKPYTPDVTVSVPQESLFDIAVRWDDAAGNASQDHALVQVDTTNPNVDFLRFYADPDPSDDVIPATIGNAWDNGSPITNVRFRTDSGAWGASIAATSDNPMVIDWPAFDPTYGGTPAIGLRTVSVQVQNAAGLWSSSVSETLDATLPNFSVSVSEDRRTGHPVTITPNFPQDVTFADGTYCRWEFRWGSTSALDEQLFDETYGGMVFDASAVTGGCGPWTFTLPWVPYPQFDVVVELVSNGASGARGSNRFTAVVDSTDPHITTSNLPVVQVLPTTYTPIAGQPVTYERFLFGGALACCFPLWSARLGDGENPDVWESQVGDTFTFTPMSTGTLLVQWNRTDANGLLMGAYYDPPVREQDSTAPTVTAPVTRVRVTASGSSTPLSVTWGGSDVGWGIGTYEAERSTNGGAWAPVALTSPTATAVSVTASSSSTVRFRVRARDKAGNVGTWAYGPTIKVTRISDTSTSIRYSTGWSKVADSTAFSSYLHETKTLSAKATYSFTGRDIAWIAEKGPGHGKARVYIDGVAVATIDLTATSWKPRQIVYTKHWSTVGTHSIKIVNLATSGRRMIDLDGFVTLR
jgi:hypothetical protein